MDATLTISALTFGTVYNDQSGSKRIETSRGVNLPEILSIRHTEIVDKVAGPCRQSSVRFERHMLSSDGLTIKPVRATLTIVIPKDTGVTSADALAVVERHIHLLQEDDSGLNLASEIVVDQKQ